MKAFSFAIVLLLVGFPSLLHRPAKNAASETILHSFHLQADGKYPNSRLMRDAAGNLFGTTVSGGDVNCGCGSIFELAPNGAESLPAVFLTKNGAAPFARLFQDKSGAFYGSATRGGAFSFGVLFRLSLQNNVYNLKVLHSFSGSDGADPREALISDSHETLYGTTYSGGQGRCDGGCGTVFRTPAKASNPRLLYAFSGGADGGNPGGLIMDGAGALYGTTIVGGTASSFCTGGCGTVFKLTPSGSGYVFSTLYQFQGFSDGAAPTGTLYIAKDGTLYGTTTQGGLSCGTQGCGTVFALKPGGSTYVESILYRFHPNEDGIKPVGNLVADKQGALYGVTQSSSRLQSCNCGTVFMLSPSQSGYTETILHAFQGDQSDGAEPHAGLIIVQPTRTLFGTTYAGGSEGVGTVFKVKL